MVNCFPADICVILSDESYGLWLYYRFAFGLTHRHKCYVRLSATLL